MAGVAKSRGFYEIWGREVTKMVVVVEKRVELGKYGRQEVCGVGNVVVEGAAKNGFVKTVVVAKNGFVETVVVAKNRVVWYFSRG